MYVYIYCKLPEFIFDNIQGMVNTLFYVCMYVSNVCMYLYLIRGEDCRATLSGAGKQSLPC